MHRPVSTSPARILIVEDDATLEELLHAALRLEGWEVELAADAHEAEQAIEEFRPHAAILDVHLGPGPDGLALARRIRARGDLPFVFLTDRVTLEDRLAGFESGADDYLAKPFKLAELVARLRVVLARRGRGVDGSDVLQVGPLKIDESGRQVFADGRLLDLTRIEFDLLVILARRAGRVATKDELLSQVWGFEGYDQNLVQVHLSSLRRKLGAAGRVIQTVRGVGYVLRDS